MILGASIRIARPALPLFVGAACLALTLTGCSDDNSPTQARQTPSASTAPKPAPALTATHARDVIAHYSKTNNEANADRNRRLLDTVEDGPLYAMSVSDYTETEGLPKADRKPYKPWSYDTSGPKLPDRVQRRCHRPREGRALPPDRLHLRPHRRLRPPGHLLVAPRVAAHASSLPGLTCRPECATASVWVCVWEKRISAPPSVVLRA